MILHEFRVSQLKNSSHRINDQEWIPVDREVGEYDRDFHKKALIFVSQIEPFSNSRLT